jgi:hypothetical protein
VLPLRRGAAQLRTQLHFAGGNLRRRLQGVLGCLCLMVPVDPPLPGALHGRQGQGPAPARLRRWAHVRVTEHGNLRVPALQHDDQQLRGDMVWFYLRNDGAGLPPYTGKVLDSRPYN